jgi:hypothetical protein
VLLAECIFATAGLAVIVTSVFLGFAEPQFRLGTESLFSGLPTTNLFTSNSHV